MLEQLDIIFDTQKLLELEFRVVDTFDRYILLLLISFQFYVSAFFNLLILVFTKSLMAMSQEDMLKRARQLKKQKTTTLGASPSVLLPHTEVHEEVSEPDPEPLTQKFKSRGKKIVKATSQNSISQAQLAPPQTVDDI